VSILPDFDQVGGSSSNDSALSSLQADIHKPLDQATFARLQGELGVVFPF
jgi:hypothetical protein